jgi:hypothetical protein
MIWIGIGIGIILGMVIGFGLGVWASRGLIEEEKRKALEMATTLIEAREQSDRLPEVHPSVSLGCTQQFLYEVIFGGEDDGTEEQMSGM